MVVRLSPRFKRAYKKLPSLIRHDFDDRITTFMENPDHLSLKVHKLKGRFQQCLAFKLRDGYRVLFEFAEPGVVDLLDVGPHSIYQRR